jgi:hypothetical protein
MAPPPESGLTITRLGLPVETEELRFYNSMLSNVIFTNVITPNFTEQQVYGRNEPLVVYRNTTRTINFSFTMVSPTESTKYINKFQRMVYPLFKVRYNNLIVDPYENTGLIGIIKDLNVGEQFSYGRVLMGDNAAAGQQGVTSVPSLQGARIDDNSSIVNYASMKVTFNFIPLPSKPVGYNSNGEFRVQNNNYPFKLKGRN